MKVNEDKTKIIVFRNGGVIINNEKWYMNGVEIDTVTYYRYLGLFFSSRRNWSYAVKTHSMQSEKAVNNIKCVMKMQWFTIENCI